jgi:hypothetical protein
MTSPGTVQVFTFKKGLLSRVAHDLRLSFQRFEIDWDGPRVTARFHTASLRVDGVMRKGQLRPDVLSAKDGRDVLKNTEKHVLHWQSFPIATYTGTVESRGVGFDVRGSLELVGRRAPVVFTLHRQRQRAVGRTEIVPSLWGIPPFSALMGAMQVQDRVGLAFDLPLPEALLQD